MDRTQVSLLVEVMLGWTPVGVAGDEAVEQPISPYVRAFVVARLGNDAPNSLREAHQNPRKARALAGLLREAADYLHPSPETPTAPEQFP